MPLELLTQEIEGKTFAVVRDGKPVYRDTDNNGAEVTIDAQGLTSDLKGRNSEAANYRRQAREAQEALEAFKGLDPAEAAKAIETVKNLDDKKLVDAGKVEEIKTAAIKAVEDKYKPIVEENGSLKSQLSSALIDSGLNGSKFAAEKMALPKSAVNAMFRSRFELQDGKPVAKDDQGNPIYSRSNPGQLAGIDEALEIMVMNHPDRDSLLLGDNKKGTGAQNQPGKPGSQARTMTRAEFNDLQKSDPKAAMDGITGGEISVVD